MRRFWALLALLLAGFSKAPDAPAWSEPTPPFRIVGNIYYVGTKGLAAYLIASPRGLILLDATLEGNVRQIEASIVSLGFRLRDIRILLNSHAHFDHAAGLARLKRDTGATMLASAGDRGALESGTPPSVVDYGVVAFPPVKIDRVLVDGEPVRLGDIAMTPVITPGHTPGCTTWTMTAVERERRLRVVFPCSLTVAGNALIGNTGYPGIVADFRRSFVSLAALKADVVLPAHPDIAGVLARKARRDAGDLDAFIAPESLGHIVADAAKAFDVELARQTAAARRSGISR
ncbi:subclass B3 metallo-beta-lactamase [Polymorphobacter sp. PAMC 29334]|uniref:subclass B3 metallo-beta-lactamase n=1 Tax=Polymorphobacter sp. PAMC 29334 TaxID=2862331 RepID=UPI001C74B917|nr:subclass B3 metallo-beta-lactamase [Polymorphobacter sp. PAMC 29334]QYE34306.1 subclass B3 metallo-beta-lactamase [Polymorphobacter sp. PAMC 29334]